MFKDKPLSVKNSSLVESDNDLPPELKAVLIKKIFILGNLRPWTN